VGDFVKKLGFDNEKYLKMQSEKIRSRIAQFGGKLYLEFGGKLFDDYHASRVLPGFSPDSKIKMLCRLQKDCEVVIAINSDDIGSKKLRGDIGISYPTEVLRLIDAFRGLGLYVGSVVITQFKGQEAAVNFRKQLEEAGFDLIPGEHPIVPVMLYDPFVAQEFAKRMLEKGVYVVAFAYPVVPKGKDRIRTQVSAGHTKEDLDFAVKCFKEVKAEMNL
jgi:uncharacterized protein (UPF0371 family)